jgi:hypothetical protein
MIDAHTAEEKLREKSERAAIYVCGASIVARHTVCGPVRHARKRQSRAGEAHTR